MAPPDGAQPVLAPYFHGQFEARGMHSPIWQRACQIVERCESRTPSRSNQQTVVLCMRVRPCRQPMEDYGIEERRDVLLPCCGVFLQKLRNLPDVGSPVTLILHRRRKP